MYKRQLRGSLFERIEAIDTATLDTDKLAIANDAVGSTYGALLIKMVETGAFATSGLVEAYENAEGGYFLYGSRDDHG